MLGEVRRNRRKIAKAVARNKWSGKYLKVTLRVQRAWDPPKHRRTFYIGQACMADAGRKGASWRKGGPRCALAQGSTPTRAVRGALRALARKLK